MPLTGILEPSTEFFTAGGLVAALFVNFLFAEFSGQRLLYGLWCLLFVVVLGGIGLIVMPAMWAVLSAFRVLRDFLG